MGRHKAWMGVGLLAVLAALGCGKSESGDGTKVLANVGGTVITEADLASALEIVAPTQKEALLHDPAMAGKRNQILNQLAELKQLAIAARAEGLESDPAYTFRIRIAQDEAYAGALQDKLAKQLPPLPAPTDADLRRLYEERLRIAKAKGQDAGFPAFDAVKDQVAMLWRQQEGEKAKNRILESVKAKIPVTIADEYRAAPPSAPEGDMAPR